MHKSQRLQKCLLGEKKVFHKISFLRNADGGRLVVSEGVVKWVELELVLFIGELKEKDCGVGASTVENLKEFPCLCNVTLKTKNPLNKLNPKCYNIPLIKVQFHGGRGRSSDALE